MPFDVFLKLYESLVWPVIAYGAALWRDRTFACIEAVQNRAMRFYLGVGRYTPTAVVTGDMGWEPAIVKQFGNALVIFGLVFVIWTILV